MTFSTRVDGLVSRSPRAIAEAIIRAVGDAEREHRDEPEAERGIRVADAVLEELADMGIRLVLVEEE